MRFLGSCTAQGVISLPFAAVFSKSVSYSLHVQDWQLVMLVNKVVNAPVSCSSVTLTDTLPLVSLVSNACAQYVLMA